MNDTSNNQRNRACPIEAASVRFSLSGRSTSYDPARQAIRPDLADIAEAAHHFSPHYATPAEWRATCDAVMLAEPNADAEPRGTLTAGDAFALLDLTGGWAWGYRVEDHIVGYVAASSVAPDSGA